jgi:RHS repeat-associated protein
MTETLEFFITDHLGSVTAILNEDGSLKEKINYDTWGNSDSPNAMFCGKEKDASGLIYMNARYYDPVVGRFLTEDPAQQHTSWYSYCGNNPLNHTDPDGRRESAEIQKITSTVEKNMKSGNFLGFSGKGYGSFAPALVDGFLAHTGDWYNTKGLFPSDRDTDKKGWNQLSPHDIDTNCAMEFRAKGLLKLGQDLMRHDTRSITVYSGTPDKADMWKAG